MATNLSSAQILSKYKTPLAVPIKGVTAIGGKMAVTTNVGGLGLDAVTVAKLSSAGQKLTKGDLISIWDNKQTTATKGVTVNDLKILKTAFTSKLPGVSAAADGDINCCCCPCCCAATVMRPVVIA